MLNENINIELNELSIIEKLDKITLLVCSHNGLTDLVKILNFQKEYENFLPLEYCSSEVNKKLLSICEKYKYPMDFNSNDLNTKGTENKVQENAQTIPNYSIETLVRIENLDSITQFICKQFKLLDLKCILDFYQTHGSFVLLDSSNSQVNKKLLSICEKYKRLNQNIVFKKIKGM